MKLPILCYHQVGRAAEHGRRLNIEPTRLGEHVRYLRRRGYRFVLARDLANPWPAKGICLTFDDAYTSTVTAGVEAVRRGGGLGSIYAVTDFVGRTSEFDEGGPPMPLADWDQLLDAQKMGFEIGNHSLTHPHMDQHAEEEQWRQVAGAHEALIEHGLNPGSFCYPYGHFNLKSRAAAEGSGYRVGLALNKRIALDTDDRLLLPRIVLAYSDTVAVLMYKLNVKPWLKGQ
jgi:peptidoglycan/xylan/chitin deacetylase (PgdA/CDA1 family)